MAERLHQVQGEGGPAAVGLVEKTEVGIEAGALQQAGKLMHEEGVAERE